MKWLNLITAALEWECSYADLTRVSIAAEYSIRNGTFYVEYWPMPLPNQIMHKITCVNPSAPKGPLTTIRIAHICSAGSHVTANSTMAT